MGSGSSAYLVAITMLAATVLYVAWRQGHAQEQLKCLRAQVEAAVTLHELEEQVLPSLERLERRSTFLERELQKQSRGTPTVEARGSSVEKEDQPGLRRAASTVDEQSDNVGDMLCSDLQTNEVVCEDFHTMPPEISLLLLGGAAQTPAHPFAHASGIATTRVFLGSPSSGMPIPSTLTEASGGGLETAQCLVESDTDIP